MYIKYEVNCHCQERYIMVMINKEKQLVDCVIKTIKTVSTFLTEV